MGMRRRIRKLKLAEMEAPARAERLARSDERFARMAASNAAHTAARKARREARRLAKR